MKTKAQLWQSDVKLTTTMAATVVVVVVELLRKSLPLVAKHRKKALKPLLFEVYFKLAAYARFDMAETRFL